MRDVRLLGAWKGRFEKVSSAEVWVGCIKDADLLEEESVCAVRKAEVGGRTEDDWSRRRPTAEPRLARGTSSECQKR